MTDLTHNFIPINNLRMHVVTAGPETGPLVILLHGFPEFWLCWQYQIPVLAEAGYRVVAPDQRGYNLTDKTPPYDLVTVTDDVIALIQHLGREKATVVGHDWGGAAAWYLAMCAPELVDRLIVLNAPHGLVFREVLRRSPRQMLKSWYMFAFQLKLVDWLIERSNYNFMERMLTRAAAPGLFEADLPAYRAAWAQPGAVRAMIGWYRAMFKPMSRPVKVRPKITLPTMLIWGTADRFLGVELAEGCRRWVPDLRLELLPGISHWVSREAAEQVNRLILDFLKH